MLAAHRSLLSVQLNAVHALQTRNFNANRCTITKIKRSKFLRHYPTTMVFQDGSTITFRYSEPRAIVKMPLTPEMLTTDAEKNAWTLRRRKVDKVEIKQDITDVAYDANKYLKFMKKP